MKNKLILVSKIFLVLAFIYYFWYVGFILLNHLYMLFNMSKVVITINDILYLMMDVILLIIILLITIKIIKIKDLELKQLSLLFLILLIFSGLSISNITIMPNILLFVGVLTLEIAKYKSNYKGRSYIFIEQGISDVIKYFKDKKKQ